MVKKVTFDLRKLKGLIKQYYDTQSNFANATSMSCSALSEKLNNVNSFTSDEIYYISKALYLKPEEIGEVFFTALNSENRNE